MDNRHTMEKCKRNKNTENAKTLRGFVKSGSRPFQGERAEKEGEPFDLRYLTNLLLDLTFYISIQVPFPACAIFKIPSFPFVTRNWQFRQCIAWHVRITLLLHCSLSVCLLIGFPFLLLSLWHSCPSLNTKISVISHFDLSRC
jgi:hypothetical protein